MKRVLLFLALSVFFFSCAKEEPFRVDVTSGTVKFELSAEHPAATKAVKSGWEQGDVIFVFFNKVSAPRYLKMTYNGESWSTAEMDGYNASPDCLRLKDGDSGMMRAVFLPFGRNAVALADGDSFVFDSAVYSYYLTATLEYTVADSKVSGAFKMTIPDGFVQFYIDDYYAATGLFSLATDAVIPVGIASIRADGAIVETTDKVAGDAMLGYAYDGGYLFSGKLAYWPSVRNYYYFVKDDLSVNTRADCFVEVKQLTNHKAVKLPTNASDKWQRVGADCTVNMKTEDGKDLGTWYTCNYKQTAPEDLGDRYDFASANSIQDIVLPTESQMEALVKNCTWHWMSVHGKTGMVVKSATGFLFLPTDNRSGSEGHYWTSSRSSVYGARLYFHQNSIINVTNYTSLPSSKYALRLLKPGKN